MSPKAKANTGILHSVQDDEGLAQQNREMARSLIGTVGAAGMGERFVLRTNAHISKSRYGPPGSGDLPVVRSCRRYQFEEDGAVGWLFCCPAPLGFGRRIRNAAIDRMMIAAITRSRRLFDLRAPVEFVEAGSPVSMAIRCKGRMKRNASDGDFRWDRSVAFD